MSIESVLEVSRAGLAFERMRMDAASRNIAGANVPVRPGEMPTIWRVDDAMVDGALAPAGGLGEEEAEARLVQEPEHPYADEAGNVRYPAIDLVHETTEMMTASRGYEANVRSFNLLRSMVLRALEIGAK